MEQCDLLIKDASLLIRCDQLEHHRDLAVCDGKIRETGKDLGEKYAPKETLDGKNKLFLPGPIEIRHGRVYRRRQLLYGRSGCRL